MKCVEWVKIRYDVTPHEWHCTRCGDRTPMKLPMEVSKLLKVGEGYSKMHEDCEPQAE